MKDQAMTNLTEYEIQILREVAGELPASPWGAWVGVCCESLYESGYITAVFGGRVTDKGREVLKELRL